MTDYIYTHLCPPVGSGVMPCCGLPPFERRGDRMTVDPELVTCGVADFEAADRELREGKTVDIRELLV